MVWWNVFKTSGSLYLSPESFLHSREKKIGRLDLILFWTCLHFAIDHRNFTQNLFLACYFSQRSIENQILPRWFCFFLFDLLVDIGSAIFGHMALCDFCRFYDPLCSVILPDQSFFRNQSHSGKFVDKMRT